MIDQPFAELAIGQKKTSRGRNHDRSGCCQFLHADGQLNFIPMFRLHVIRFYGQRLVQGSMVFSMRATAEIIPLKEHGPDHSVASSMSIWKELL